jgi:hypothetical protein
MRPTAIICIIAALLSVAPIAPATAQPAYDGAWSLTFVTQQGGCDPTYHFEVNISNGIVSHPNLRRFNGRVTAGGVVHASVTVEGKQAAGSGRLTNSSGRGTWSGRAGSERCSGYWTARRF